MVTLELWMGPTLPFIPQILSNMKPSTRDNFLKATLQKSSLLLLPDDMVAYTTVSECNKEIQKALLQCVCLGN